MAAKQLCTFHVADGYFGIPVEQVQEVVRPQPITPVPLAPKVVRGLINLRGQILTAIDLRFRLGLGEPGDQEKLMNVVVRTTLGDTARAHARSDWRGLQAGRSAVAGPQHGTNHPTRGNTAAHSGVATVTLTWPCASAVRTNNAVSKLRAFFAEIGQVVEIIYRYRRAERSPALYARKYGKTKGTPECSRI